MRNTWIVIQREYLERIRTRAFLISTLLVPAVMFLAVALPAKLMMMKSARSQKLVLVAHDAEFGAMFQRQIAIAARAEQAGRYDVTIDTKSTPEERDTLRQRVASKDIDGFIWAPAEALAERTVIYTGRDTSDFVAMSALRRALSNTNLERNLAQRGVSTEEAQQMMRPVELETVQLRAGKENKLDGPAAFLFPVIMVLFLYSTLLMYGLAVLRAVLEEKSSRIIEVLLASVSANALMAGKIVGVGAVGLTQVLIWATVGAVVSAPGVIAAGSALNLHVDPLVLVTFPIFFVLGYLLYSASFAAVGAAVNSEQEAQQLQIFVMLPIILSIVMMNLIIRQPSSGAALFFSLFPFTSPILMYLRIVVQPPPAWQMALCIGLLVATIAGMMALCARIYRVGVLMYGKKPTLPEIMRWLRYA
jgi:ABC-2 type transport system permease protein